MPFGFKTSVSLHATNFCLENSSTVKMNPQRVYCGPVLIMVEQTADVLLLSVAQVFVM